MAEQAKDGESVPGMTSWQTRAWRKVLPASMCDPVRILSARLAWQALENRLRITGRVVLIGTFVAWLVWISLPYLMLGRLAFVPNIDVADAVYPQIAPIAKMLKQGQLSLWNPFQGGGTDTLGGFSSSILGVLVFVALPPWLASGLIDVSAQLLALVGMYLLLRAGLGVLPILAALGGVLYSLFLSIEIQVYVQPCGLILGAAPLIAAWLLRVHRLSWGNAGVSVALGLLMALGGHYTWSVFVYAGIAALVFAFAKHRLGIWIAHLAIIGAVCFVVQFPFFLANLATAPFSSRLVGDVGDTYNKSVPLRLDWSLFFPTHQAHFAYIRTTYWLILIFALISFYLPARAVIAAFFYSGLCVLDWALPYTLALFSVAGYRISPDGTWGGPFDSRFVALFGPLVAVLALILAIDYPWRFLRGAAKDAIAGPPLPILVLCVMVTIPPIWSYGYSRGVQAYHKRTNSYLAAQAGLNFASNYEQPALRHLAQVRPNHLNYRIATVAFDGDNPNHIGAGNPVPSLYGPFQNVYGFETADGYASNLVGRYVRYWHRMLLGQDYRSPSYEKDYLARFTNYKWAFPQKLYLFEPIGPQRRNEFGCIDTPTGWRFSDVYDLGMLSLANVEYVAAAFPLDEPRFTLLPSSVRHRQEELLCAPAETKVRALQEENMPSLPIYIYRNEDAAPRVFAPSHVKVLENVDAVLESMRGRGATVLRETAFINAKDIEAADLKLPVVQNIKVVEITMEDDRATITIDTATGGLLVVSNAYSSFWKAYVDGSTAPIIPAYHAFQGIVVPPESKVVKLRYCPSYAPFACP